MLSGSDIAESAEPHRGPIQTTRSGIVAHGCVAGSMSPTFGFLQHPSSRSSLVCLRKTSGSPARSAWLELRAGHGRILLGRCRRCFPWQRGADSQPRNLCRPNRQVGNAPDSTESLPGNWGGPFRDGSHPGNLMAMADGHVTTFIYHKWGEGTISNGKSDREERVYDGVCAGLGAALTPHGQERIFWAQ